MWLFGLILMGKQTVLAQTGSGWWLNANDSQLTQYIEQGLADAPDIHIATARLRQAQTVSAQQVSGFLPSLTASWSSTTQPRDALGFGFGLSSASNVPGMPAAEESDETELFTAATASIGLNLPVDLWGRAWTAYRATQADALASAHEQSATELALSVSIASAFYDWAMNSENRRITEAQVETAEGLLNVAVLQYDRGEGSALDVLQQRQQVAAARSQLPQAQLSERTAEQRLLVLMGRSPTDTLSEVSRLSVPDVQQAVSVTSEQFDGHPDVAAAQARVQSADRRLTSSSRDFLPSFSVGGAVQRQLNYSSETEEWDDIDNWNFTTGAQLTLFQGGRKLQVYRQNQAGMVQAEQGLRQIELRIQQDLENAIQNLAIQAALQEAALAQYSAAEKAFQEARHQYEQGVVPVLTVLNTQNAYYQAQLLELQSRRSAFGAILQLVSAAGGQWAPQLESETGEP
ncbi:MAG: TolC family protein [Myxococcota bacterium]|nr:TolC family protein [Myxococcota bacterium]